MTSSDSYRYPATITWDYSYPVTTILSWSEPIVGEISSRTISEPKEGKMNLVAQEIRDEIEKRVTAEVRAEAAKALGKYPGSMVTCPKCGHRIDPSDDEMGEGVELFSETDYSPEHLAWTCGACGYKFATKTRDAK